MPRSLLTELHARVRAFHTLLRCRARVALAGIPPARPDSMARCEGSFDPLPGVELVVGGWVAGGLGRRVDPGSRLAAWTCSSEDAIEAKMALPLMLHALAGKGKRSRVDKL